MTVAPDMTGDGREDVLLGTAWGGRTAYLLDGLSGAVHYDFDTYAESPPYPPTSGWVYTVEPAGDVDGDGSPDFFFACGSDNDGAYCVSPIEGVFLWYQPMGDAIFSCAALDDVNGDGRPDGAFGVGEDADAVWVMAGGGGPTPTIVWTKPMPGSVQTVARIADISGDGRNDVIAGTWTSTGNVYALDGTDGDILWTAPIGSYQYIMRVVPIGDADGDGFEDVAVGSWDNRAVVLSGIDGSLVWDARVGTLNGGDVWAIGRVSDTNGDGIDDVVAGSFDYHVYLFDGATGDSLWWYNTGNRLYFVNGVADVTGNGSPDVVAGTQMLTGGPPGGRAYLLEGGDISTGVAGPSLVCRALAETDGVRLRLDGARGFPFCHVDRIRSGEASSRAAESFKQELFDAIEKRTMTETEAIAARRLTPGPVWTRLTDRPLPVRAEGAEFVDRTAEPGASYDYRFALLAAGGEEFYSPTASIRLAGESRGARPEASLSARPNPVNPATTIEFSIPSAGKIRIAVYTPSGREAALLLDGERPAGTGRIDWDGRDSDGKPLPSGTYFIRLDGPEAARTTRIVVLR